uniref:Uncharacterized protein n=1 Tax=Chromera velia CCMP2878 TaxID=1169474 RepID=A0A0G4FX08_9ALVE|eukprot:Cvel_3859.t1-p1 / transcript=Cvel_3859.t1 / gene=Cvel_3859 / organism=Chromera_velia_CCMP2878 / gene_product=hypothetical protein / transcript_product=hypothetical protein / location=Cvel_scaffold163:58305-61576(+) / protein_length=144 / sequence_SO=supercontig / SO=protein_coding / is_pseudo=false
MLKTVASTLEKYRRLETQQEKEEGAGRNGQTVSGLTAKAVAAKNVKGFKGALEILNQALSLSYILRHLFMKTAEKVNGAPLYKSLEGERHDKYKLFLRKSIKGNWVISPDKEGTKYNRKSRGDGTGTSPVTANWGDAKMKIHAV